MVGTRPIPWLAALLLLAAPVYGGPPNFDHVTARRAREAGEILPLARILDAIDRDFTGTVVEVELEREQTRWEYEIELLTERGFVIELVYDAATGGLLETTGPDAAKARKKP